MSAGRLVLLDRDGTVNVEKSYLSCPDDVELVRGAALAIRRLNGVGCKCVIVTNQSAIGRGYFDLQTLEKVHARLRELLAREQAALDGIYVCPHRPDEHCECRKPAPGLALQAARDCNADLSRAFVVGDKECDMELGRRIGARTILVCTGYGAELAQRGGGGADQICAGLDEAAQWIESIVVRENRV